MVLSVDDRTLKMRKQSGRSGPEAQLALTIVTHPDLDRWGDTAMLDQRTTITRNTPEFCAPGDVALRGIDDPHVSRRPILELRGDASRVEVRYVHEDVYIHVDGHRIGGTILLDEARLRAGVLIEIEGYVGLMLHTRASEPRALADLGIVGVSPPIEALRDRLRLVASMDLTVLLRGETGTGKELAAHAIHTASERGERRMLAVNLGALEASVIASELFGHVRGAFTGASDARRGYFRDCDGGTLFLDEVGEAPAEVQRSLLRVLETGEVVPVGADRPVRTDVRVIAATDADLENEIATKGFRAPLFHRLAEYEVHLPPLRDRRVDLPILFRHFLLQQARAAGMLDRVERAHAWIPTRVMRQLLKHDWPGNARELRNVVSAALLNTPTDSDLALSDRFVNALELKRSIDATGSLSIVVEPAPERRDLSTIADEELLAALEASDWRPEPAAAALGIAKTSIYQLIRHNGSIPRSTELTLEQVQDALEHAGGDRASAARALRVPKRGLLHRMKKLGLS